MASQRAAIAAAAALLLPASHGVAHAYLDPGTGSIILQGLIAGIIGTAAFARMYWTRLKSLLRRGGERDQDQGDGNGQ
jgi:hypothetical protein